MKKILSLAGDGIGPEIVAEAEKVLQACMDLGLLQVTLEHGLIGGAAHDATGSPLPDLTVQQARAADAVLLGAVGGYRWESLPRDERPERGLLGIRSALGLYANLRPAIAYPQLAAASTLREDVVSGLDIMIVRELTGGIYFGQPRGIRTLDDGQRQGYNTLSYSSSEIERIAHTAFQLARQRQGRVCSVDKANVLESSELWREVMCRVGEEYTDVSLSHMYVDNAAMQLVRDPKQFDVMVTGNLFGDILSDCASMLTGSIGMLPSASMNETGFGMYEPIHGSAPDIAGQGIANPLATVMSLSMLLRYSLAETATADRIDRAVQRVLDQGIRTADIATDRATAVSTAAMGDALVAALQEAS